MLTTNLLQNERVRLRALEPEDVELLYRWENDTSVWQVSSTTSPFSRAMLREFIENQRHDIYTTHQLRLVIEALDDNRIVGAVDLYEFDPFHRRAGIGILIEGPENRGRGYASAAVSIVIGYAFQTLNLHQLYCTIPNNNVASLRLFQSKGFQTSGVKKEWLLTSDGWCDEWMLQLVNPQR